MMRNMLKIDFSSFWSLDNTTYEKYVHSLMGKKRVNIFYVVMI